MILLPTSYFGNIDYYSFLLRAESVEIEIHENFPKQTYRNRMLIMTANGVIPIIVPLCKSRGGKLPTEEIEVDYCMPWQRNAWRAIESAYRNSPYFDHYESRMSRFFTTRYSTLLEMNMAILSETLEIIHHKVDIKTSCEYVHHVENDFRDYFSPKKEHKNVGKPYYQVFSERLPFAENLSIIDLIFCEGSNAKEYLL